MRLLKSFIGAAIIGGGMAFGTEVVTRLVNAYSDPVKKAKMKHKICSIKNTITKNEEEEI